MTLYWTTCDDKLGDCGARSEPASITEPCNRCNQLLLNFEGTDDVSDSGAVARIVLAVVEIEAGPEMLWILTNQNSANVISRLSIRLSLVLCLHDAHKQSSTCDRVSVSLGLSLRICTGSILIPDSCGARK